MSRGIDYSGPGSTVNRDPETGIRYGIIPSHALGNCIEDFELQYDACCPHCGEELPEDTQFTSRTVKRPGGSFSNVYAADCPACGKLIREHEQYSDIPSRQVLDNGEYQGHIDSSGDAWCLKSPYYTRAAFCSPCAPGACHLNNPCDDGERCFCFGHDWFDDGVAPYPVYSVSTNERVEPAS